MPSWQGVQMLAAGASTVVADIPVTPFPREARETRAPARVLPPSLRVPIGGGNGALGLARPGQARP